MKKWEQSVSIWQDVDTPHYPLLTESLTTEVCVVGAGIAGMSVAYHLAQQGVDVIVLDSGTIGSGQTSRTTAHLTFFPDTGMKEIQRLHGKEGARIYAESHQSAIEQIEKIVKSEALNCEFERVNGYFFSATGDEKRLDEELSTLGESGLFRPHRVARLPWLTHSLPGILIPGQGQFHPMRYLYGLASAFERMGGRIFCHSQVGEIASESKSHAHIKTKSGYTVQCRSIVVATNVPINNRFVLHTKQYPYRSYVIGLTPSSDMRVPALLWDDCDPYHYVRLRGDVLVVGGGDHKTGQKEEYETVYSELETWARQHFPGLGPVRFRWSGQVIEPVDGVGYIGHNPMDSENVYVVSGHSGQGMTYGTLAGMILTDLILGKANPWAHLYAPNRISLRSAAHFVGENANTAAQYTAYVHGGEVKDPAEIAPDAGAVIQRGVHKVACYRDTHGRLHERSAVCPHLFGVVRWNDAEKTWDCPCHGSRFDRLGHVIEGPANQNLAPAPAEPVEKIPITEPRPGLIRLERERPDLRDRPLDGVHV